VDKLDSDARRVAADFPPEPGYRSTYLDMVRRMGVRERRGSPPDVVADAVATALAARHPRARYLVGKDARRLAMLGRLPSPLLDALRRRMFGLPAPGAAAGGDRVPGPVVGGGAEGHGGKPPAAAPRA
jgi:hypothetical protein